MALTDAFFGDLGGGISSIFGGLGDFAEAAAYSKASKIAASNAQLELRTTALNETMLSRKIYQTTGAEAAQTATAGFNMSGSAIDLMRSSVAQGALSKQIMATTGLIQAQGFEQEAAAYKGMEKAANSAGTGGILGGVLQGVGAVFSLFSDRSLKEDIRFVSVIEPGMNLYNFRYIGDTVVYQGIMADEVERVHPEAVEVASNGFKKVDYNKIGVEFKRAA